MLRSLVGSEMCIRDSTDSPSILELELDETESYYLTIWADDREGFADFEATLVADSAEPVPLAITSQPSNQPVIEGGEVTFTVATQGGTGSLDYQWSFNNTVIADATSETLVVSNVAQTDVGLYRVTISDEVDQIISAPAQLSLVEPPDGLVIVEDRVDNSRDTAPRWQRFDFEPLLTEEPQTVSVAWDGDADIRFSIFLGSQRLATMDTAPSPSQLSLELDASETYSIAVWAVSGAAYFTASIDAGDGGPPDPDPLTITTSPLDQTVSEGETATFTVDASGGVAPLNYQWFRAGTLIQNADNASYTTDVTTFADDNNTLYSVEVTDNDGTVAPLQEATLTVVEPEPDPDPLTITTSPLDQTVSEGETATFTVVASGGVAPLSYQWSEVVDGETVDISGATEAKLTLASVSADDNGNQYSVTVTDSSNPAVSVTSALAPLTVEIEDDSDLVTQLVIGEGRVDSSRDTAPRWVRIDFDSLGNTCLLYTSPSPRDS